MIGRFLHKPLAVISLAWVIILIVASLLAPLIAPYQPDQQDIMNALQGPSAAHPLGTGVLGLDVLSRILYGGQITFASTLVSLVAYAAVGVPIGLIAGYAGGLIDRIILRASEVAYAVPGTIIVLVVLAVRPNDETAAMIAIGLLSAPSLARVVRASTISVREALYIRAAAVSGFTSAHILRRHVLPTVMGTVIVHLALFATVAIGLETGLGFLGVGTRQVTWGQLVAEASKNLGIQPWLLVPSGFIIVTFILALGLIGDALRDSVAEGYSVRQRKTTAKGRSVSRAGAADAVYEVDQPLVSLDDLTVQFDIGGMPVTVVDHVAFALREREVLGIVGESGSGKSVTIASLIGLLRGTGQVTTGTMTYQGKGFELAKPSSLAGLRGRRIALVGQEPMSGLDPVFTVRYQLAEIVKANTDLRGDAVEGRVLELLRTVKLPDPETVARSYPHQLSGGMAQRVCIAAALAGQPDVILADEPTTALDVTVQAGILDLLRSLDTAIVLVTHDWGVLVDLAQRAVVMYAGQVVEQGLVTELVNDPRHPYTKALLESNPFFAEPGRPLPAIGGTVPSPDQWPVGCHFADRCPLVAPDCRQSPIPLVPTDGRAGVTRCLRQVEVAGHHRTEATP